jgi:tetrathionate reductase subunit A
MSEDLNVINQGESAEAGEDRGVLGTPLSRRDFVKTSAFLGGTAALAAQMPWLFDGPGSSAREIKPNAEYVLAKPENTIYTFCRQCNVFCPMKVKVDDQGVAVKMDGSPYSAQSMTPHLPYATSPLDAATIDGRLCPKGQSSVQLLYDPYRIRKVLKRAGPRGSGKWQTISFDQAITEIVEGGKLFSFVRGEEDRVVPGLKELRAVHDPAVGKPLADDVKKVLDEKDAQKKAGLVEKFKADHASRLDLMIDPDHPDFGPKNNQFIFEGGRMEPGRQAFFDRFLKNSFGTVNAYHAGGSICSASVYQAHSEMTNEFVEGRWTAGKKDSAPEALHTEFILGFGINYFEARATTPIASQITDGLASGRLKMAVADPRLSKMAAKAWKWLPVKPGTDAALALGMTRWILEQQRYDARYLRNANRAAAKADGEPTLSNATWLVKMDGSGKPTTFLRASEIGLAPKEKRPTADGKEWDFDPFVVLSGGRPVAIDPNDESNAVEGELFADTTLEGFKVKSSLKLLQEEAFSRSIEEWARISGLRTRDIVEVAAEFTSHGKKAATAEYRGIAAHSNAFHTTMAIFSLNILIGNIGWQGGISTGAGQFDNMGAKAGQPYNIVQMHPNRIASFGTMLTRQGSKYEDSTVFEGYPSKRPWVAIPGGALRHELYPSILDGYPYSIKALFTYKANTVLTTPGGQMVLDALTDTERIPLFFSSDIVIGDMSGYADYLFPDITIWERWGFQGPVPEVAHKMSKVRQPTVSPIPETVKVFGEEIPISAEAVCLAIAEKMGLSGFGPDGMGQGISLNRPEDFYLKRVANIAFGERADGSQSVLDATQAEMELFATSRRHLDSSVFDEAKWKSAVKPDLWSKIVYVLNRGGRFEDFETGFKGDQLGVLPKGVMALYAENVARARNSMTGELFSGVARWQPPGDMLGNAVKVEGDDFHMISYKDVHFGHTRTISAYWALAPFPENVLFINKTDARGLKLKKGDRVRLTSRTTPGKVRLGNGRTFDLVIRVEPIEGIRPGVVAVSHHFGHWAYGSRDVVVDGATVKGDKRRGKGIHPNFLVPLEPLVANAIATELVSGNAGSYDAMVKLTKV